MKYRDNMTEEELAQFKKELQALDDAYASAAEHDAQMQAKNPIPDEWEDEMEILHKAGLNRGQP